MPRDRAAKLARQLKERYGKRPDLASLPESHATLLLVERVQALLDDGGFPNLLFQAGPEEVDLEQAAAAHDRIGAADAAKALRWALSAFVDGPLPRSGQRRHDRYVERFPPADFCDEKPCPDWLYFHAVDETRRLLVAYVESRAEEFS